jgi:hypothetical protein
MERMMSESSSQVLPCEWPVESNDEKLCGKPAIGRATAASTFGGDWTTYPLDLCQEHLDEARLTATSQANSQTPAQVVGQPENWRPKMGERVIIVATKRVAKVTAELLHERFEVEPVRQRNTVEPGERYEVYHLSELRPE